MKTSAIICEYNPFHNGHKFQIDTARSLTGCDAVVALMSGNFVQRGDFALFPKNVRAKAALLGGADLILENHTVSVLRSAEGYASAAVYTLSALGCVDYLVFGAECGNVEHLTKIAKLLLSENEMFRQMLSYEMSHGFSFAAARGRVVGKILGADTEEILRQPNNILAIEYIKAIIKQGSSIEPVVIQRTGAGHNSDTASGNIASASYIRDKFIQGEKSAFDFVPQAAAGQYLKCPYVKSDSADKAILSHLCMSKAAEIASAPDISEGLENKIKTEAMQQASLADLIAAVKSKRYAYSRIRRAILCSYLKITKDDTQKMPKYIKILDFNQRGRAVLNTAKKTCSLPLTKNASILLKNADAMENWKRELAFDRVYEIFMQNNAKK